MVHPPESRPTPSTKENVPTNTNINFAIIGRIISLEQAVSCIRYRSESSVHDGSTHLGELVISVFIEQHDIYINISSDFKIDIDFLIEVAEGSVKNYLNAFTLDSGLAYDFILTTLLLPNADSLPLIKYVPSFSEEMGKMGINFIQIFELSNKEVFRALEEFKSAITSYVDKGFHAYRAIEAVRKYFDSLEDNNKKRGWVRLNNDLNLDRKASDYISDKYADEQRHGGFAPMNPADSKSTIEFTREVIVRFAVYLKNGKKPLDKNEFETLKYVPSKVSSTSELIEKTDGYM